jgi:long-chain acyl-CoA synthetase
MKERIRDFYRRIGYPEPWLREAEKYGPADSYVIFDPEWSAEPLPEIPEVSIYELFRRSVERDPGQKAVIFLEKTATYRELDDLINRYAALLLELGVKKGDVVAAMLPNSIQHCIAFYGATRIGAVHNPINVMYKPEEIAYQLKDSGAKVALVLDILYNLSFAAAREQVGLEHVILTHISDWAAPGYQPYAALNMLWNAPKVRTEDTIDFFEALEEREPTDVQVEISPREDVALLLYTAGTSAAQPKGVLETHFNLVFNSITHGRLLIHLEAEQEVNLTIMPMFHTAGYLLHTLPCFYRGGTWIPMPLFDPQEMLRLIEEYKVNVLFGPPTLFISLMASPAFKSEALGNLEYAIACGAPVPPAVQEQWEKLVGMQLLNGWGMTETNCGGCISIPGKKGKLDALGVPVCGEVKITDDQEKVVPRGEIGEINFRGLQVAKGYLNKPEETARTFGEDGWLRTGDLGYIDEEDFLYFVDRKKDLIIASGYNLAPVEVENVIYQHPAVAEVIVVGVPDEYRGETVMAVIVLKEEYKGKVTEEEIREFCRERLASFKVPKIVEFRDALPKSAVGKLLRRVIREEYVRRA